MTFADGHGTGRVKDAAHVRSEKVSGDTVVGFRRISSPSRRTSVADSRRSP
jgi:hypothetical protein